MGENHRTVPLPLIKFSIFENFNAKIFIYIEISYKLKFLIKILNKNIKTVFIERKFYNYMS